MSARSDVECVYTKLGKRQGRLQIKLVYCDEVVDQKCGAWPQLEEEYTSLTKLSVDYVDHAPLQTRPDATHSRRVFAGAGVHISVHRCH